ncbi:MAG: response regulator transcription factor [Actinomycetota bacterium]|nr:response regulator transcription factor [Actinomycetota bacterium]
MLVVEDEERLGRALANGLRNVGFDVKLALDGEMGYQLAKQEQVDVIVLDLLLPGMSGVEVCRRLRAEGRWTPILVLTARGGEADETEVLDAGADDYLRKPFSYPVLLARCRALLRRGPAERPPLLSADDLVVDVAVRTVRRGDVTIDLTRREFALLEYLMRHRGVVRSKQEILNEVWGAAPQRDLNVVEVYIGYLRRKVDEPFGTASLRTLRGQGYRLGDRA